MMFPGSEPKDVASSSTIARPAIVCLPWLVRHVASDAVVASFAYQDHAQTYVDHGYLIGSWKRHEVKVEKQEEGR